MEKPLLEKIALIAGATSGTGRGIAVELGSAGATVYVTGRTIASLQSEMNRPDTIEETAALVSGAGASGREPRGRRRLSLQMGKWNR